MRGEVPTDFRETDYPSAPEQPERRERNMGIPDASATCASDASSDRSTDSEDDDLSFASDLAVSEDSDADATPVGVAAAALRTIIFVDWDDTLLPTSWLAELGLREGRVIPDSDQWTLLQNVAESSTCLLRVAMQYGRVVIVTNAERGWVEHSCQQFFPSMAPVLEEVTIVSARSSHQHKVDDPTEWKRLAFAQEIRRARCQLLNVISIGDSIHELHALFQVARSLCGCRPKSVKLLARPRPEQLAEEHAVLEACFGHVAEHDESLDLQLS